MDEKLSKQSIVLLDILRRDMVTIVSEMNDLELMKKLENCDYDSIVQILNLGFSEKAFFDALTGKVELKVEDITFTEKSRELLMTILKDGKNNK